MSDLDMLVTRLDEDGLGFGIGPAMLCQEAAAAIRELQAERDRLRDALREARDAAHSLAHSEFDGVWHDDDFVLLTPKADAALAAPPKSGT